MLRCHAGSPECCRLEESADEMEQSGMVIASECGQYGTVQWTSGEGCQACLPEGHTEEDVARLKAKIEEILNEPKYIKMAELAEL